MNRIIAALVTILMLGNSSASRTMQCDDAVDNIGKSSCQPIQLFSIYDPKVTNQIVQKFLTGLQDAILNDDVDHLISVCDRNTLWIHGNNAYRVSLVDHLNIGTDQIFTPHILEIIMNATLQKIVVSHKGLHLGEGQIQIGISKLARDKLQYTSTHLKFISIRTS